MSTPINLFFFALLSAFVLNAEAQNDCDCSQNVMVFIDLQNFFYYGFGVNNTFPDVATNIPLLVNASRANNITTIWLFADYNYINSPFWFNVAARAGFPPLFVSVSGDYVPFIHPVNDGDKEVIINKANLNPWDSSYVESVLDSYKGKHSPKFFLNVAGLTTGVCVSQFGIGGVNRGYNVTYVKDAIGEVTEKGHKGTLDAQGVFLNLAKTNKMVRYFNHQCCFSYLDLGEE